MNFSANPQHTSKSPPSSARARSMLDGRNADSLRRRQRVLTALERAAAESSEISASRAFLYRHRDHLEQQVTDMRLQVEERDDDLAAARAANRELMARLNASNPDR